MSDTRHSDDNSEQVYAYEETTCDITIKVSPYFLENHSYVEDSHYVWAYQVLIENNSDRTWQLRNRHWQITDGVGKKTEVRGRGVIGEQPVLAPGASFSYTSGTPLETPSGIMVGSYEMVDQQGEIMHVAIPPFSLDSPYWDNRPN
ncbi:MAG: Co2+/Mg2+ efflux protein ApaG [Pseudomonadota bacterium]